MNRRGTVLSLVVFLSLLPSFTAAQKKAEVPSASAAATKDKQAQDKQRSREKEKANRALAKWLDEVDYIISPSEEKVFKKATTDEEREQFIESFWLRRDPTPETAENEFRDDFYLRIAYANDHYAAGIPGWKTDRGRIYVMYGPADEVETHPSGGGYHRPYTEGGGMTTTFPFEKWRYRHLDGVGQNIQLEFVDDCICNEYRLTPDPSAKDAMINVPGGGLFDGETNAFSRLAVCKAQGKALLGNCTGINYSDSEFTRLLRLNDVLKPPPIKFADLVPSVTAKILANPLSFHLRTDFVKITDATVHTPVTLQFSQKDLTYREISGTQSATVRIHGEVRDVGGRLIRTFEDTARNVIPVGNFSAEIEKPSVYQANLYLNPGHLYSIYVAIEDVYGGAIGTIKQRLQVPAFPETGMALSTLILADKIEPLPARNISPDIRFALGDHYVRPSVKNEFRQEQSLKIWSQAYGVTTDEKHKPSASFEILILRDGNEVKRILGEQKDFSSAAQQLTIIKEIALADFAPGSYSVQLKVTDNLTKDTVTSLEKFTVRSKP